MGAIVGGAAQVVGSLVGGGARRREAKAAAAQKAQDLDSARNFNFSNPWANLENTAEDLTINQQATNVQAQQTDAALAQGLDAITQGGGGGGSAQAIAAAALQSKQGISADIASQEANNQRLRAQQAAENQSLAAQGEEDLQSQRYEQAGTNLELSAARDQAARDARQAATQGLVSGIGSIVGGVASGGLSGIGGKIKGLLGKKPA